MNNHYALRIEGGREDADVIAVVVTKGDESSEAGEDESSEAEGDESSEADITNYQQVIEAFEQLYSNSKARLFVFGVAIKGGDEQCLDEERTEYGLVPTVELPNYALQLEVLAEHTGGSVTSICLDDYSELAHNIVHAVQQSRIVSDAVTSDNRGKSAQEQGQEQQMQGQEQRQEQVQGQAQENVQVQ